MKTKPSILSLRARGTRIGLVKYLTIGLISLSFAFGQSSTTFKKQLRHDDDKAEYNSLYKVNDNIALLAYSGYKGFGYVRTFSIASDGSTIDQLAELKFDDEDAQMVDLQQVASDMFVVAYTGRSNDGFITTIKVIPWTTRAMLAVKKKDFRAKFSSVKLVYRMPLCKFP